MSIKGEDNIERFFKKASAAPHDADTSYREEDWQKMEKMLDEEAARHAAVRAKKLKIAGGGAGVILILAVVFYLTTSDQTFIADNHTAPESSLQSGGSVDENGHRMNSATEESEHRSSASHEDAADAPDRAGLSSMTGAPGKDKELQREDDVVTIAESNGIQRLERKANTSNESKFDTKSSLGRTGHDVQQSLIDGTLEKSPGQGGAANIIGRGAEQRQQESVLAGVQESGSSAGKSDELENVFHESQTHESMQSGDHGSSTREHTSVPEREVIVDQSLESNRSENNKSENNKDRSEDPVVGFNDSPVSIEGAVTGQQKDKDKVFSNGEEVALEQREEEEEEESNELKESQESRRLGDTTILHDKNWPTSKWSFALVAAPDFSRTGLSKYATPGKAFGVLVQYQLNKRLMISSGVIRTNKIYWGFGSEYHPPEGYWARRTNGVLPQRIDGTCMVLEVPLTVRYNLMEVEKNLLYASAGISSYLMQNESYQYTFEDPNPGAAGGWRSDEGITPYWFGVGTFSVGYERTISSKFSLGVEPYLKVPFAGVGWADLSLYSAGAYVNVRYRLLRPAPDRPPPGSL